MNVANFASLSPTILGLETSCDETAAAILDGTGHIASSVLYSQHEVHGRYGGVVPELAARRHIETVEAVVVETMRQAGIDWADLQAVAVTQGPGLAGALLVGVSFGKALAYARNIPLIGVNHLEGHMASAWLDQPDFPLPCVVLVVSGGHTHLYRANQDGSYELLGRTLDDAAGEAFDKAAKMLELGYPGGPAIDRLAGAGNPRAVRFPRASLKNRGTLDFSFSGLKTSLLYYLRDLDRAGRSRPVADIAAGFQEAIVDVLVEKAFEAVARQKVRALAVVGGVSANSRLRTVLAARAAETGIRLALPPAVYSTDNAAMIAAAGRKAYLQGRFASWELEGEADLAIPTVARFESEPARKDKGKGKGSKGTRQPMVQRG
jgi:N6-L-threonylcarbamoyladenine synthase